MYSTPRHVSEVMTRTVVALGSTTTFKDIVKAMRRRQISALPVIDDAHRVVGVVSEADLLPKEEFRAHDPDPDTRLHRPEALARAQARTAGELMTAPAVTVDADASLARAARIMARHQVKHLPVVDGAGLLTGIVSRTDLLKVFLRTDADIAQEVRREVVEPLFPDPLDPVRVEVRDGVVALAGRIRDTGLVPIAVRLARAVEGVVDVDCALMGPPRRPVLDPDPEDHPQPERSDGPIGRT
ncbi:CBS domain-containing protein [Streptomyces sp. NBC_00663]|uniref:CBS domain-containing protein n=1 Tax=Streptomyces sp. NBC_00663 TaxID=2975801 RepID=UPI002E2F1CFC|nr:CBS domain-containing protein [Streptomyces sp. NBC_00663]